MFPSNTADQATHRSDTNKIAEKTNNQSKDDSNIKLIVENIADGVLSAIDSLLELHSPQNYTCNSEEEFKKYINTISYLAYIKDKLNEAEKINPSIKDFAIIQFCCLIAKTDEFQKELNYLIKECNNICTTDYKALYSKLNNIIANFDIHWLKEKMLFLKKLKEKSDFCLLKNDYEDEWDFNDLLQDEDFQQYIHKTIEEKEESIRAEFKEKMDNYIKLANQGKEIASKYFEDEVEFQAYYTQDNILNVNLTDYDANNPIKIGDILQ